MQRILILFVRAYRTLLSPILGNNCRFYPSCSSYAETALKSHGAFAGSWLAIKRILRCHPWHPGGVDEVPEHSRHKCQTHKNNSISTNNTHG